MNETPDSKVTAAETSSPEPASREKPHPKRPWTILGRLSQAVREQNWFAVMLEVCIVIVGVVIGFQVTAWGQARQDIGREQAYLRQLLKDLTETEEKILDVDSLSQEAIRAGLNLQRAFYAPQRTAQDSLNVWWWNTHGMHSARPVAGTAEAMVSSGDITLVRNDSLRSSVVQYVENIREQNRIYADLSDWWHANLWQLRSRISPNEIYMQRDLNPQTEDSLGRSTSWPIPSGPRLEPFPEGMESLLTDRAVYHNVDMMRVVQLMYRDWRARLLQTTRSLRKEIEAEIHR